MRALALCLCLATPALAEDWRPLQGAALTDALAARVLQYENGATQNFFQDGRTLYSHGAGESWGTWWVAGDLYCSTWPPSATLACYSVAARGLDIRFTDRAGRPTTGRYIDL